MENDLMDKYGTLVRAKLLKQSTVLAEWKDDFHGKSTIDLKHSLQEIKKSVNCFLTDLIAQESGKSDNETQCFELNESEDFEDSLDKAIVLSGK